jgi:hypothetical protein
MPHALCLTLASVKAILLRQGIHRNHAIPPSNTHIVKTRYSLNCTLLPLVFPSQSLPFLPSSVPSHAHNPQSLGPLPIWLLYTYAKYTTPLQATNKEENDRDRGPVTLYGIHWVTSPDSLPSQQPGVMAQASGTKSSRSAGSLLRHSCYCT